MKNLINLPQVFQSHKHREQTFALKTQRALQTEGPMLYKINMISYKALHPLSTGRILRAMFATTKKILHLLIKEKNLINSF